MSPKILLLLSMPLAPSLAWAIPVSVQVTDAQGQPVNGVVIEAQVVNEKNVELRSALTDSKGMVQFEATPSQPQPEYLGRFSAWKAGLALGGGALTPGGTKITLLPGASVSGRLVDAEKKPLANVAVRFSGARTDDERTVFLNGDPNKSPVYAHFEVRSDAQGRFRLNDLPPQAQITVSVADPRFITATASLRSGAEDAQISLRPGATVQGTLIDAAGAPLSGVRVYAIGQDRFAPGARANATTDAQGRYVLHGLSSGNYEVNFSTRDKPDLVAAPQRVSAVESQTTQVPPLQAQSGILIGGTVRDATSRQAVAGASVRVQALQPALPTTYISSDDKGHWQARVLPGTLKVSLSQAPPQFLRPADEMSRNIDAQREALQGEGLQALDFELTPATKISGRIVDESGQGVKTRLVLSQSYQEWPLQSDVNGNFSAFGPAQGDVRIGRALWGEDESAPGWEVVQGASAKLPAKAPLLVVVRPLVFATLEGRVLDQTGAPLAGAQVTFRISTQRGDGTGTRREVQVSSDANGLFRREKLRSNEKVEVSATKANYDFAEGGVVTKAENGWTVAPLILRSRTAGIAGRVVDATGKGVGGAQVFAAGAQTRSAPDGGFVLEGLPSTEVEVMAYQGQNFALLRTQGKQPVELRLSPLTLQAQDVDLARSIIEEARAAAQNTKYYAKSWLKLSANEDFAAQWRAAQALSGSARDGALTRLIASFASRSEAATATLLEAVTLIGNPAQRLYSAGDLWSKRSDWPGDAPTRELVASLDQSAGELAKRGEGNDWQLGIGLFTLAPILERFVSEKAADVAFNRADAWNVRHFPEKSTADQPSRDDILRMISDQIALTSPRLLNSLLESISDPTAPEYSWSLEEGAVAVAKTEGLKAAMPLLERLRQAPPPRADERGNRPSIEWRYAQAVRRALAEGKVDAPAEALRLAQSLIPNSPGGNDFNRARAIAEAAFALPLDQARPLWRESLVSLEPSQAARYAVRIAPKDRALALEILDGARAKLETADTGATRGIWGLEPNVAAFAFYEAEFDPVQARYRLEKGWVEAAKDHQNGRGRSASVRAMAKFDGLRAWQWAKQLDGKRDDFHPGIEARRKIVQWIEADARMRQNVPFDRWGASDTWSFGDQEW